jgi:hypothetical protein
MVTIHCHMSRGRPVLKVLLKLTASLGVQQSDAQDDAELMCQEREHAKPRGQMTTAGARVPAIADVAQKTRFPSRVQAAARPGLRAERR